MVHSLKQGLPQVYVRQTRLAQCKCCAKSNLQNPRVSHAQCSRLHTATEEHVMTGDEHVMSV